MTRTEIMKRLWAQIKVNGHVVGTVASSGMTAKYEVMGGADFLLALSAGRFRIMGRSSFSSYLCYGNSNEIVMKMGSEELLTLIKDTPILFGLFASDPNLKIYEYLQEIKRIGFSGIVNYPTLALFDGKFGEAIQEEGNVYEKEVEAIRLAHYFDLFTVAFVVDAQQAKEMAAAGADVVCAHLGLTKGGFLGAKKYISIHDAKLIAEEIFNACDTEREDVIKMIYAGPANTPIDMQYLYQNTECQGYIGGSTFDRIPAERAILNTTKSFKSNGSFNPNDPFVQILKGEKAGFDYAEFVKKYIHEHYMSEIQLRDLAAVAHVSPTYLSIKFKKEQGMNFSEYLVRFRLNKAKELLQKRDLSCKEISAQVGYTDYSQFSKIFRKYIGVSPVEFIHKHNPQ